MTKFEARAGDIISVTGTLKYGIGGKTGFNDQYIFLTAVDGTEFTVQKAPDSAMILVKTSFAVGDIVQYKERDAIASGTVLAISGTMCFVEWSDGSANALPDFQLQHYEEPHHAKEVTIEEYLGKKVNLLTQDDTGNGVMQQDGEASEEPDPNYIDEHPGPSVEDEQPSPANSTIF